MTLDNAIKEIKQLRNNYKLSEERYLALHDKETDDDCIDKLWLNYLSFNELRVTLDIVLKILDEVDK